MRAFFGVIGLSLYFLAGCGQPPASEDNAQLRQELEEQKASNERLSGQLQALTKEIAGEDAPPAAGGCPSKVRTWTYKEKGTTCEDLEANVRGYSWRCVGSGACDSTTRLAEAVADARATCKAFCDRHKCPNSRYSPPEKCAEAYCYGSSECPAACPDKDSCYLQQGDTSANCWCDNPSG